MIKVGIVGMGVIGTHIARAITTGLPGVALAGVTVRDPATAGSRHNQPWRRKNTARTIPTRTIDPTTAENPHGASIAGMPTTFMP